MASLIGQDTEAGINITSYTEPGGAGRSRRTRYQITRTDSKAGSRYVTLDPAQLAAVARLTAELAAAGVIGPGPCSHRCNQGRHCGGCGCPGCGYSAEAPL